MPDVVSLLVDDVEGSHVSFSYSSGDESSLDKNEDESFE